MKHAVFRADATAGIGGGHVSRCLTLADELSQYGWHCAFATVEETLEVSERLARGEFDVQIVPPDAKDDAKSLMSRWPEGTDLLVVDHYGLDAQFERECRSWAHDILVIDDLANRAHHCDWLLDQTVGRNAATYNGLVPIDCKLLCGADYALLRPQFSKRTPTKRPRANGRVLVSMGTTDPGNATGLVLEKLAHAHGLAAIDIVLGRSAPSLDVVSAAAKKTALPVKIHTDVSDMASAYAASDLVVGAAGVSALERCALGVPSVILVIAENQQAVARNLAEAGAAMVVDEPEQLAECVERLLAAPEALKDMGDKASRLCDGRGAHRVAMALHPEHAFDGRPIRLRAADMSDAEVMFDWQRAPETRRFAHNTTVPDRATHIEWCRRRLADPDCIINIVLHDETPVGVLRLDRAPNDDRTNTPTFVVSILVSPDYYRRGIGGAALALARRLAPDAAFIAEVHQDNAASHSLFRRAGYTWRLGRYEQMPRSPALVEGAGADG